MKSLLHFLRIFFVQIKNNWVREAVYRANFLTAIVVDLVWIAVELSLFSVIYSNTDNLAGWTRAQTYFFLGVFFASDAFFTVFFQRNFWMFSDLVNKGELDILLMRPVRPLFLALTRWINLTALFNVVLGVAIAVRYADAAGFEGGLRWFLFAAWLALGVFTQILVRLFFSLWVFWTERSFAMSRLYYQFFAFATKPDSIYPRAIRFLIKTALPFAFIASIPSRALLRGLDLSEAAHVLVVLGVFFVLDLLIWNAGLRRYQSASS